MRGAGGSRTRFCGFADRRPAVRLRRPRCFDPPPEGHVLARNRTWSPTFAKSCARPSHPEDVYRNRTSAEPPTRESNPALRLRRPPCVRHTRGETAECPCQESNLVFDLRGVACRPSHAEGASRSRRPGSNRHEPAYKAGASPFGHVGGSRGARIRTLSASFGGSLLSQEHAPVEGPRPVDAGAVDDSGQGAGPARRPGTSTQLSIPDARARRRAASTRGGPGAAGGACRPARGCGRPCGRCTARRRPRSWSSSTHPPASAARRGRSVIASQPGWAPQYWQVWWSRLATFRRLKVTAAPGRRSYWARQTTSGTRRPRPCRPDARAAGVGLQLRPLGPVVEAVLVRLDDLRRLVPEHDQRPDHGRDVDRLPVPVQDQRRGAPGRCGSSSPPLEVTVRVSGGVEPVASAHKLACCRYTTDTIEE